jgi:sucrose-6-phosphate hydrolase SacC (GH32 family)
MSNWQYAAEVPTRQFRSANTLPRDLSLFTAADGQVYLASTPSPEVERLRAPQHTTKTAEVNLTKKPQHFKLPTANDGICEILLEVSGSVTATLSNAEGERCVITYDEADHAVSFDRRKSGLTDFSQDFPAVTVAPQLHRGLRHRGPLGDDQPGLPHDTLHAALPLRLGPRLRPLAHHLPAAHRGRRITTH